MTDFICPRCGGTTPADTFAANRSVCGACGYHARLSWKERIGFIADRETFAAFDEGLVSQNPLNFPGYEEKIRQLQEKTGANEAVITGSAAILGYPVIIGVMESAFMMGSMGSAAGEKITRAFERGAEQKLPVVLFTASGGARMQEGIFSLMQMAKTAGAAARHSEAGALYIAVLTDPTTGGVAASFASLGDIIMAEPGALIGFAGKRVIQDTLGARLPENFQTAEFVREKGFVDLIVPRHNQRSVLARLIRMHGYQRRNP
ncbi:MAG: acetyl-CoA carboxylase, carboxyltransferase subunit beta [Spirochaetaceae bacterium]|jgi:acetyl-CoA carboxylase carboxyl transferase subunit beta|nr:acetyl-CoA carboxylase, carboxyltransferase subunit beta [Spirochaetaceae bacterium]